MIEAIAIAIASWVLISVPVALLAGAFIAGGSGETGSYNDIELP